MGRAARLKHGLTAKEEKFAQGIASGLCASDAYRAAYNCAKSSDSTIHRKATHIKGLPHVRARIDEIQAPAIKKAVKKAQVTQERIVEELALIAFSNISQVFNEDGSLKKPSEMSEEVAKTIRGIKTKKTRKGDVLEITREDKLRALELLGRNLAMFTDNNNHNITPIKFVMELGEDDE